MDSEVKIIITTNTIAVFGLSIGKHNNVLFCDDDAIRETWVDMARDIAQHHRKKSYIDSQFIANALDKLDREAKNFLEIKSDVIEFSRIFAPPILAFFWISADSVDITLTTADVVCNTISTICIGIAMDKYFASGGGSSSRLASLMKQEIMNFSTQKSRNIAAFIGNNTYRIRTKYDSLPLAVPLGEVGSKLQRLYEPARPVTESRVEVETRSSNTVDDKIKEFVRRIKMGPMMKH